MEIKYMQTLKVLGSTKNWNDTGVEESEIATLESNYNINFPVSYREFLILTGNSCSVIVQGHGFEYAEQDQIDFRSSLKEYKLSHLISKPIWVIATLDGGAFWYFHLDEGDNPVVYRLDCENYGEIDDKYTFGKVADSFQDWIEQAIKYYEEDPENE